mgnify:CR=1 FL=1
MKKINIKLLTSIILTYFVLINYGFSETYVCSYKWGDEIRMNPQEKRTGSTFTSVYEDGSAYEYKNVIEYEDRIILVDSINSVFFKVIWKNYCRRNDRTSYVHRASVQCRCGRRRTNETTTARATLRARREVRVVVVSTIIRIAVIPRARITVAITGRIIVHAWRRRQPLARRLAGALAGKWRRVPLPGRLHLPAHLGVLPGAPGVARARGLVAALLGVVLVPGVHALDLVVRVRLVLGRARRGHEHGHQDEEAEDYGLKSQAPLAAPRAVVELHAPLDGSEVRQVLLAELLGLLSAAAPHRS